MSGQDVFMTEIWISDDCIFCQAYNNAEVWYRYFSLKSLFFTEVVRQHNMN